MPDVITLSCPSCGGKLEISQGKDRITCPHCGNKYIVHNEGRVISLKPQAEAIEKAKVMRDKIASELAISRLNGEIAQINQDIKDLEQKLAEELKQLYEAKAKLESIPCIVIIVGILISFVGVIYIVVELEDQIRNLVGSDIYNFFSLTSGYICLGAFIFVILMNPKRLINRKRIEPIQASINAKKNEYMRIRSEYQEILERKQGELADQQRVLENSQ